MFSEVADKGQLCPDSVTDGSESRINLEEVDGYVWRVSARPSHPDSDMDFASTAPGIRPSDTGAIRASCYSIHYGKSFHGDFDFSQALYSYDLKADDLASGGTPPMVDSLGHTMTSVVINPFFHWGSDHAPRTPYHETIIYETHVRGMTQTHPGIPDELRHLRGAGPSRGHRPPEVPECDRPRTHARASVHARSPTRGYGATKLLGLQHFWILRPPQPVRRHPACGEVPEFKTMVRLLHEAGIEVILDVVYNHTAEGNHLGPTINFRGIDNAAYYRLLDTDLRYYKGFHRHRQQPLRPPPARCS